MYSRCCLEPAVLINLKGPEATPCWSPAYRSTRSTDAQAGNARRSRGLSVRTFVVLPGLRSGEIDRMLALYGRVLDVLSARGVAFQPVLPAVERLRERIERETAAWPVPPRIVTEAEIGLRFVRDTPLSPIRYGNSRAGARRGTDCDRLCT